MTGLREALEKALESLPVLSYDNNYRVQALPKSELLDTLAAHPAEPAPVITAGEYWDAHAEEILGNSLLEHDIFAAGWAAARELQPAPVASREALEKVIDQAGSLEVGGTLWPLDRKNVREIASALLAAGVFRDESTVKAEVLAVIDAEVDHSRCAKRACQGVEQLFGRHP